MLLTVSTQPAANSDFTADAADIDRRIGYSRPGGMTALIDTVYSGFSATQAREAIAKVGDALRSQYILGYQPAESVTPGKSHRHDCSESLRPRPN